MLVLFVPRPEYPQNTSSISAHLSTSTHWLESVQRCFRALEKPCHCNYQALSPLWDPGRVLDFTLLFILSSSMLIDLLWRIWEDHFTPEREPCDRYLWDNGDKAPESLWLCQSHCRERFSNPPWCKVSQPNIWQSNTSWIPEVSVNDPHPGIREQ